MKTYKFKLRLTKSQEKTCTSWLSTCRALYNLALSERIMVYEMKKKSVSKYNQYNQLPELKKLHPWMAEVYSDTIQEVLDRVDKSYQNFYRGAGFPKFSKKGQYNSFTFKRSIKIEDFFIKLPKIGKVKYYNSRPIIGTPKTATLVKEDNGWFICITAEYETPFETVEVNNQNPIGCDMGGIRFLALSNNTFIDSPEFLKPFENNLRLLQRKLSRQKKGSNSREKTKQKIRKVFKKVFNQRLDFMHKTSTNLADTYSAIYIEDLKLQKMQENGFTSINKMMVDKSFGNFKTLLSYKLKERGKYLGLVSPAYTSQTCFACKTIDKKSRISQSEYVCTSCGNIDNSDSNASKNILSEGITAVTKRKTLV